MVTIFKVPKEYVAVTPGLNTLRSDGINYPLFLTSSAPTHDLRGQLETDRPHFNLTS